MPLEPSLRVAFQVPARCYASRRITAEGDPVGRMYRDDGWVFLVGDETQEIIDDPATTVITSVETVVSVDHSIQRYLALPEGSDLLRRGDIFVDADSGIELLLSDTPPLNPEFPIATGRCQVTEDWSVQLPGPMNRRVDDGALVLWRPGVTAWINVWSLQPGESPDARLGVVSANLLAERCRTFDRGAMTVMIYTPVPDDVAGPGRLAVTAASPRGHLDLTIMFDGADDEPTIDAMIFGIDDGSGAA